MRKMLIALACVTALGLSATTVGASPILLVIVVVYFLGSVIRGTGNESAEMSWVNKLAELGPDFDADPDFAFDEGGPQQELLYRSDNGFLGLPIATTFAKNDSSYQPLTGINVQAYDYLLGKYGGAAYVWVVRDLDSVLLPASRLSHYTLFSSGSYLTPDGGMTIMLLGGALMGLGVLRRKFRG